MPYAMKVTEDNLALMIENAKVVGFDLSAVEYDLEEATSYGWSLYQITDGSTEYNNITFTTMHEPDFFHNWKFTVAELPNNFAKIERV